MKTVKIWLYFSYLFFAGKISEKTLQDAVNASKDAVTKEKIVEKWQSETLKYAGSVTTDPQQNLNFLEFFQTREGLWIQSDFADNVLKYVTGVVDTIQPITALYFNLKENLSDSDISREFQKNYAFGLIEGLALIVWLLLKQWGGEKGALLKNGRANIFHLHILNQVLVVDVRWGSSNGIWSVNAWKFDKHGPWDAGWRVFSCEAV